MYCGFFAIYCFFIAIVTFLLQLLHFYCNYCIFIAIITCLLQLLHFYCIFIAIIIAFKFLFTEPLRMQICCNQDLDLYNPILLKILNWICFTIKSIILQTILLICLKLKQKMIWFLWWWLPPHQTCLAVGKSAGQTTQIIFQIICIIIPTGIFLLQFILLYFYCNCCIFIAIIVFLLQVFIYLSAATSQSSQLRRYRRRH